MLEIAPALFEAPANEKRRTAVIMAFGIIGPFGNRPVIGGERVFGAAAMQQQVALQHQGRPIVGLQRDRSFASCERLIEAVLLHQHVGAVEMRLRAFRLERDGSFIGGERFVIPSKLGEQIAAADLIAFGIGFHPHRFVVARERFLVAFERKEHVAARVHQFGIVRVRRQCPVEDRQGLAVFLLARQDDRVIGKSGHVARREPQQRLDARLRILMAVEGNEHIGAVMQRENRLRVELQGAIEILQGTLVPAGLGKAQTTIDQGDHVVWLEPDRRAQRGDRIIMVLLLDQHIAVAGKRFGRARIDPHRPSKMLSRLIKLPELAFDGAQHEQRIKMRRLACHDGAAELGRARKIAALRKLMGAVHRFHRIFTEILHLGADVRGGAGLVPTPEKTLRVSYLLC